MTSIVRKTATVLLAIALVATAVTLMRNSQWASGLPVSATVRADEDACSLASLHGTYAVHAQGTVLSGLPGAPFPFGEAGIITFDGKGNHSGKTTVNLGGNVQTPTLHGTYTVNSDCTGAITVISSLGLDLHDALVVTRGGRGTVEVETDPFVVITRTTEKIGD